eukprot:11294336-Ditylum_brightwellii.AAC.1
MRMPPTSKEQSNPDVKQAVIVFMRPTSRQLECDTISPIYKLSIPFFNEGAPKEQIKFWHRLQAVLKGQNITQGPPSYAVAKTLLKGNALTVFKQAEITHINQTVTNFELCLDDVAKHVFPE